MTHNKAFKYRLYPNRKQKELINKTLGCTRFVYNYFLEKWNLGYEQTGKGLSYNKCATALPSLKKEYEWLLEVDSIALQSSVRNLSRAFESFFRGKGGSPVFKTKKNAVQSYTTRYTNDNIRVEGKKIHLPKLGNVKFKATRDLEGRIINATVKRTHTGKYFVSVLCETKTKPMEKTGKSVGIDMGLMSFAVFSDDTDDIPNPGIYKKYEEKLKKLQRSLSRKKKGGQNYIKTRKKIARLHEKIRNSRNDFLHKKSTDVIKSHDVICIESLGVKDMMEKGRKGTSKSIQDASWAKFLSMLEYKAKWYRKTIQRVPKYFPSTQICSCCGNQIHDAKDMRIREWECPVCCTHHDRDINASNNILKEGINILSGRQRTAGTAELAWSTLVR